MNILVTYHSMTGNTKRIAEAIHETVKSTLLPIEQIVSVDAFDVIFIGFPIHEFGPSKPAGAFISTLHQKDLAIFVTHAMLKGIPLHDKQMDNCRRVAEGNTLRGLFSCRGELSEGVAKKMLVSRDEHMRNFGKMRGATLNHPNANDMKEASTFAKRVVSACD